MTLLVAREPLRHRRADLKMAKETLARIQEIVVAAENRNASTSNTVFSKINYFIVVKIWVFPLPQQKSLHNH